VDETAISFPPQTSGTGESANGNAPSMAGESQQDAEHISPASTDHVRSQSIAAASTPKNALGSVQAGEMLSPEREDHLTPPSDQNVPVLTSEQSNLLFPPENCGAYTADELHKANLDNYKESKELFGKFSAHLYDRVLPALNESIKRLKEGAEINGFSGERQVGGYLESVGYTAELVRQWNKRYRERMAALKKVLGLTDGNGGAKLTPEQREVRDTLMQQGYKDPEATRWAKAAEGNSVIERFDWAIERRAREISERVTGNDVSGAINAVTEESTPAPAPDATEPSVATELLSVTTVTPEHALPLVPGNSVAHKLREALANEPDRDVASKLLTEYVQEHLRLFSNDRIHIKEVKVIVEFAGRNHRIMPGDFLEKRERNASPVLCKCAGVAEFMLRRRIRDWDGRKWGKEHVVFSGDESDYRVITEETARRIAPEAFPTPTSPVEL
jgi:hypothetical protein